MRGTFLAAALIVVVCGRRVLLSEDHVSQQRRDQLFCFLAMVAARKPNGFVVSGPLQSSGLCRRTALATTLQRGLPSSGARGAPQIQMLLPVKKLPDWIRTMPLQQVDFYFADFRERLPVLESPDSQALAKSYVQAEGKEANADDPEVQKELAGAEVHPTSFIAARALIEMIFDMHSQGQKAKRIPTTQAGEGLEVLELGCGTGLPSLAALRTGAEVTSVDRSPLSRYLVSESASLYPSRASQRHRVVNLDLFDVFERMENPLNIIKEVSYLPNIVVANQVFNDNPRLATAVGRFMGAAAAQGAGVIACMEAGDTFLRPETEESWNSFFEAFNDAVKVFHTDGQKLSDINFNSDDSLAMEPVPEPVLEMTAFANVPFAAQEAEIFYLPPGTLTQKS
mmetsp:Transcript_30115/g.55165  ORF Transcript_30115/g.55165 Transcript_30115/m.55165 type:complete len:396 (-) Transcript_30115:39-1226(-)